MKPVLGFAVTGSFCTVPCALRLLERLTEHYSVIPILSETAAGTDTRFGKAEDLIRTVTDVCGRPPVTTIREAEPLGPKEAMDLLLICPCTGNTLAKMALGITDTSVTMAAKAHRRCGRPVLIALSTNDGLSGSAPNLGRLLQRDGFFFVPFRQDDPVGKPQSLQFDPDLVLPAVEKALRGEAVRPLFSP